MFWENLINLCNSKNISPNKMCADIGLSTAIATKWKNGSVPRSTTIKQIADYFNVTVESLLLEKNNPSESVPEGLDKYDSEILTLFSALPENKKQQAVSYLEFLRQQDSEDK